MTICSPILTSKGIFWNTFDANYSHSSFALQQYSGPIWWNDKFRILLLIEQSNSGGYLIATSSNREDIISNWNIIKSIFQEKVEKTGLSQFSETFLLNIYKKLYKKLYKLSILQINNISNNNNNNQKYSTQQQQQHQHQQQDFQKVKTPSSFRDSTNGLQLNSNGINGSASNSSITLGKQRRVGLLFKELYQADPTTSVDKLLQSISRILQGDSTWMEWQEEMTGMRPIHVSVQRSNINLLRYLIDQKVDINIKDSQGWSPLHFSTFSGNLEICQILIEQGNAAVMTISKDGTLPLHYLAKHSFGAPISDGNNNNSGSNSNCNNNNSRSAKFYQMLELLLSKGTPIDAKTIRGESALHRACLMGSIQVATFLIDKKANIDIQNVRGETPLFYSVIGGNKQIAKLLIENGADSSIGGATGNAVDAARSTNQKDLLCFLASFEKSISSRDIYIDQDDDDELDEESNNNIDNNNNNNNHNDNNPNNNSLLSSIDSEKPFYPHVFIFNDFKNPTWCSFCSYYLWGIKRQGYTCEICGYNVHPKCKKKATLSESCDININNSNNSNSNNNNNQHHNHSHHNISESNSSGSGGSSSGRSLISSSASVDEYLSQSQDIEPQPLHKKRINRKRLESLYNHFTALNKDQTGIIFKKEFGESLGSILNDSNTISNALFNAFDSNGDGKMDLRDFLNGISILQNSPFIVQLKFAFKMLDKDNKGYVTIGELCNILDSIHSSLENLKIKTIEPIQFIKSVFPKELYLLTKDPLYDDLSKSKNNRNKLTSSIGLHRDKISPPNSMSNIRLLSNNDNNNNLIMNNNGSASTNNLFSPNKNYNWINQNTIPVNNISSTNNQSISLPNLPSLNNLLEEISIGSKSSLQNENDINFHAKIYFKDYRKAIIKNKIFIQSLGMVSEDSMQSQTTIPNGGSEEQQKQQLLEQKSLKWINFEGKEITLGHENWETMQCIMIGIRRAIGESITLPNRPLKPKDFEVISEFKYNGWIFRDFAPLPFKRIRDKLEIDTKFFMFTLGPEKIFGNLLLGNLSVLCEVMSSGRSGSMFFRSNEGRYLIKTIPPNEEVVLKNILPSYVQHLYKYPNTLLTRVLGCYNIMLKSKDLKFIVMNNLFFTPLPIHEKYDLKGSTIGRHVELPPGSGGSSDSNELKIAEIALKDLDFKRKLYIGPTLKAPLLEQIEHDTKFLESHNICDYSLLVGVHRIDEHSPLALSIENGGLVGSYDRDQFDLLDEGFFKKISGKTSLFQQYYGGILSMDRKEVYFISIIDTFTTWDFRKKYENMFKSIVHDSTQISAINPFSYRKRFQKLLSTIVE